MMTRQRTIYWLPRGLALAYFGFTGLFALDLILTGQGGENMLLARLIYFTPALFLLLALGIAWRNEWIGGLLFVALGVSTCVFFSAQRPQTSYLLIDSPLYLIGSLFWLCAFCRRGAEQMGESRLQAPGGRP